MGRHGLSQGVIAGLSRRSFNTGLLSNSHAKYLATHVDGSGLLNRLFSPAVSISVQAMMNMQRAQVIA